MITMLLAIAQITCLLILAHVISNCILSRSPHLASTVCLSGIVLAAAVIPLRLLPIPGLELDLRLIRASPGLPNVVPHVKTANDAFTEYQIVTAGNARHVQWQTLLERFALGGYRESATTQSFASGCLMAWGVLVALGCMRLIIATSAVFRLGQNAREISALPLYETLQSWGRLRQDGTTFKLLVSEHVDAPCVTWLKRGAIYVPEDFLTWSGEEHLAVIAHEAAHEFRRDPQWRLLADLVFQLISFHPVAWLLKRQFVLAQEMAADREASSLLSLGVYRTGLCQLALRMDSQARATLVSFGVSVSTNVLVRRIKVLSSLKSSLPRWQRAAAVAVFLLCSLSVALWSAQADDTVRLASRSTKAAPAFSEAFARGTSQPWEEVGVQSGYCRMLPSAMARNELILSHLDEMAQQLGISELNSEVRLSRDLQSLTTSFQLTVQELPENDRRDGQRYAAKSNTDNLVLQFSRDVDWAEVADRFNLGAFAVQEHHASLRMLLKSQGTSKTLRVVTNDSSAFGDYVVAKSLWPVVEGGVTTLVFPLKEASKIDPTHEHAGHLHAAWLAVAQRCRFAGVGVDFALDASNCKLRLALVPSQGRSTQEIVEQVEAAIATTLATLQADATASEEERGRLAGLRAFIAKWQASTLRVDETIEEVVLIEGPVADLCMLIPLL